MIRYDRILIPVDGSDASHTAARYALALADATGAAVDVVHVVEASRGGTALGGEEHARILSNRGETLLSAVRGRAEGADVEVTTALLEGAPYRAILDRADETGAHLVAMGRHGAGSVGERLLGGVTEKVLRSGTVPVLAVRPDGSDDRGPVEADQLLLPTDGSECAELAAEHAATVADLADATLHVVSVADLDAAGGLFSAGGLSEEFVANVEDRCAEAADRMADAVASATGRDVETAVVRGRPAAALEAYVEGNGIDAVVMGAHGRSGFERWMLGSVTERLLRTLDVPVLVVPGEG